MPRCQRTAQIVAFTEWQTAAGGYLTRSLPEAQTSAEALARRAIELDGADAEARAFLGDREGALAEAEGALALG